MQILKFGGSSLADATSIRHVAQLVREYARGNETIVVCSACAGVTDRLIRIASLIAAGNTSEALAETRAVRCHHHQILAAISPDSAATDGNENASGAPHGLEELDSFLLALVNGMSHAEVTPLWTDAVLSYGERTSVRLVAQAIRNDGTDAVAVDATDCIVTNDNFGDAKPLLKETRQRCRETLLPLLSRGVIPVVTGFIGATLDGEITTLGRNSSDFSAAIIGHAMDAHEVWLWTNVDGVFSRDPAKQNGHGGDFTFFDELSYDDALRLAEGGAKVLHPKTIHPLKEKNIALRIRNTFRPAHSGTRIGPRRKKPQ